MSDLDFIFEALNLDRHQSDLDALARLCFAKDWRPGIFEWKYRANPQGVAHAVLAFHRGVLAGFYGVIPSAFRVGSDEKCVYQAVDAMVHPDFRRKRLFSLLGRKTYDLAKAKEKSLLVFGITNYHILPGHLFKLGSHLLRRIVYRFTHRLMFWNRRRHEEITVEEVRTLSLEMNDYFISREQSPCPAEKIWNRESLEWRVFMDPRQSLRILLARKAGR